MSIAISKKQNIGLRVGLILALLFLAALDLISRYYFFVFIAFFLFAIKEKRTYRIDASVGLLIVLALSWAIFAPSAATSTLSIFKPFSYVLCYIMGAGLFDDGIENNDEKNPYRLFYTVVIVMALGTFAHYLLNWSINRDVTDRFAIDIWTGDVMAATGQAALACLPLGLAIAALFSRTKWWVKAAAVLTVALVLLYNLILSGRTLIVMTVIVMAVAFLHRLSTRKKGKMRLIAIVLAVVLLVLFAYELNLFNVRTYIEQSPFYERFFTSTSVEEINSDSRLEKKLYYLENMDKFWFGGGNLRLEVDYAHDIILDTYDEAGIFAFLAIVGYLVLSAFRLLRCVTDKTLPFEFKSTVLCVYVIVYLEFMVEPILLGMPWLFATFCLIDGYVGRILSHSRIKKHNEGMVKI